MVKICPNAYPASSEEKYAPYFEKYPFLLSSFQKFAIESIVEGNHILVTAHTGSGKTLPAEFTIEHFAKKGKKVIYTSPIKALSNQKFYEFTHKFPHISFGILTGDIKTNPEADVLIMTTEILMNTLYAKNRKETFTEEKVNTNINSTMFEMDFENELACVVFDEIHYINDQDRGRVWEETIMMLPHHVQMVMLSATLDSPEKFALWCENRGQTKDQSVALQSVALQSVALESVALESVALEALAPVNKIVYLTTTYERVIPLTHYSFITCTQGIFKIIKDKELEKEIMKTVNTLHVVQDSKGNFNDINYMRIHKTLKIFQDKNQYVKRQHVLNTVAKYMVENNMLPAICFVLSRKALEQCAKEITTNLLEDDSKVPYTIRRECEQIIRKLPNYQEYLNLPEYVNMVSLLEKGVAIHHAGIMPILREMVELLFSKGYIKLLFATETFAVGINMPTKTVIFTDVNKFDGTGSRPFYSHEYTQMAGRAGRRGIDTVGHVIHLTNLFRNIDQTTLRTMLKGKPQTLVSKFKISYNLLLNLIDIGETNYTKYAKRSMIQNDIDKTMEGQNDSIRKLQSEIDNMSLILDNCKTPIETVTKYIDLQHARITSVNKKRKEIDRNIQQITDTWKTVEKDIEIVSNYNLKKDMLTKLNDELLATETTLETNVGKVIKMLRDNYFIRKELKEGGLNPVENGIKWGLNPVEGGLKEGLQCENPVLSLKGHIATNLREVHCLIFAELIHSGKFKQFGAKEIVGILSCFTNISVPEDKRYILPRSDYIKVNDCVTEINDMYQKQLDLELKNQIDTGIDYSIHFDLIDYSIKWCETENDVDCKILLNEIGENKEIFLGEFIKAILKINNITSEMEKVAELLGDLEFLSVLKQVPQLTLKFVATNQSLYV
jgi:superfamily II RNA helicase